MANHPIDDAPAVPDVFGDADPILEELKKDFERLKRQKSRPTGGVEGTTLLNLCFLNDEQYTDYKQSTLSLEPKDANKLYLSFNLIAPRLQKIMGRLAAFNAPFKARPNKKDPSASGKAEIVDRMTVALDEKLDEPSRLRETLYWLAVGGTAFRHITWVPNATIEPNPQFNEGELLFEHIQSGEIVPQSFLDSNTEIPPEMFKIHEKVERVGEVGDEVLGPFNVFIDQSVRSVADLSPDQWVHIAKMKTVGWIMENFEVEVEASDQISLVTARLNPEGASTGGVFLRDLIPMIQGSMDENDPEMVLYIQSYQPSSNANPHGRVVHWVPEQKVLHDAENPYEEIPLVDIHFSPTCTTFWSRAYVTPLIAPQRFINKRMSQLGEQANATIYSNLLLGAGLKAEDIPADFPGAVEGGLLENGTPAVQRVPPPEIPNWFLSSIETAVKMFNDAAGGQDLLDDNKFPGQLRGPLAVPMLQEILDTQWGPLFNHLGERLARTKQMRLNRVKQFYPPIRTMHYTDKTQEGDVFEFHTEEILRSGTNFSITVERGSLLPELRALRESRITERLNGPLKILYMDERTGRLDKSKIAADLQFGDAGREARESRYRRLGQEIAKLIWSGQEVPPVQPFYDHVVMIDELEDQMSSLEYQRASQPIQALFIERWNQHAEFLAAEAEAQQKAQVSGMVHNAVAQAVQQAAATAAAQTVEETREQMTAQDAQPTERFVEEAARAAQGRGRE